MADRETCGLQKSIRDEQNDNPIYKTVEYYAEKDRLGRWHADFLDSYKIMASNKNTDLTQNEFTYGHACSCFQPFLDFGNKVEIDKNEQLSSAPDCQARCGEYDECVGFIYDEKNTRCKIYSELSGPQISSRFTIYGTKECSRNAMRSCTIFQ